MGASDVASGISILQKNNIPHYILPEAMTKAFSSVFNFSQILNNNGTVEKSIKIDKNVGKAKEILSQAKNEGIQFLTEDKTNQILSCYDLPVLESYVATTKEDAVNYFNKIGSSVVLKVLSNEIIHKYDVKGIELDLKTEKEVEEGFTKIMGNVKILAPNANIKGILVRKMIPKGEEVIIGIKRDNAFGPVIMYGLGGIFVEIFHDIGFRIAPLNYNDIKSMVLETKSSNLLMGARGRKLKDLESLYSCLAKLSELAIDLPEIKELDINPLILLDKDDGAFIADAKIML